MIDTERAASRAMLGPAARRREEDDEKPSMELAEGGTMSDRSNGGRRLEIVSELEGVVVKSLLLLLLLLLLCEILTQSVSRKSVKSSKTAL